MSSEKDTIDSAGIPSDQDIHQNTNRTTEDFKQLKTIASLRRDSSSLDEKNIKGDVQDIKIAEIGDDTALDVENDVELVLDKARGLTIEECRKLCGGHGYLNSSGLPELFAVYVPACTYEGDNVVLLLQVSMLFLGSDGLHASHIF